MSVLLTGNRTVLATVVPGVPMGRAISDATPVGAAIDRAFQELLTFDSGMRLIQAMSSTTTEGLRISKLLGRVASVPIATPFRKTSLGSQLQEVARIIALRGELGVRRQIFSCVVRGFDTHAAQLIRHATLLGELDQALTAFWNGTLELGVDRAVTTFTASEFGRTLQPSTGAGTDHGWGSHHFVIGGAVLGGRVFGTFPAFVLGGPNDAGARGVWIPTTSMSQYGATLASWFGVGGAELATVFPAVPNFPTSDLGFLA
jgi:uncharacterized protein (DUF1501 family)